MPSSRRIIPAVFGEEGVLVAYFIRKVPSDAFYRKGNGCGRKKFARYSLIPCTVMTAIFADTKEGKPAIVWEKTVEDAIDRAKPAGKPVLVDFYMIA